MAALNAGYIDLVKASLAGSILGNLLLILGLALLTGASTPDLTFNRTAAGMSAAMLALAVAGSRCRRCSRRGRRRGVTRLSQIVAGILAFVYLASLVFTLRTHRKLFAAAERVQSVRPWPVKAAIAVLAGSDALVAVESELLVDTIEPVTRSLGVTQTFLGLIVIPIVGNAAEHATAVVAARKGKTELALQIAMGSSTQVAFFVAPLLVLAGDFLVAG